MTKIIYSVSPVLLAISLFFNFLQHNKLNEPLPKDSEGICKVILKDSQDDVFCKKFVRNWISDRDSIRNYLKVSMMSEVAGAMEINKIKSPLTEEYLNPIFDLISKLDEGELNLIRGKIIAMNGAMYPKEMLPLVEKRLELIKNFDTRLPEETIDQFQKRKMCL